MRDNKEVTARLSSLQEIIRSRQIGERKLNDLELKRVEHLKALLELGIEPYPAEKYEVSHYADAIKKNFDDANPEAFANVCLAGRLMAVRGKGKAMFANIQDSTGRIQIYIRRDDICPDEDKTLYNTVFKKLLDMGDFIGIRGYVFRTGKGEISVRVTAFKVLSKTLRTLPVVKTDAEGKAYDKFVDPEKRFRQRYVDLTVNPEYRTIFLKRARLIQTMRSYFNAQGWLEVETPILQAIHGGAAARPFATHHNSLDMPLYLRIANELYLKKLIIGGFDGVYEFGKMFRNEGMDLTHNPEFTSMEIYVAYKDYNWMMEMVEDLLEKITLELYGKTTVEIDTRNKKGEITGSETIDFKGPYVRMTLYESIKKYTGTDVSNMEEAALRQVCKDLNIEVEDTMGRGKLIDALFVKKVEPKLIQPTYITDYPIEMTPLAKKHRSSAGLVERFELFVMRKEIANAYSELNDPIDQRERFVHQLELATRGDDEAMVLDEDFLRALEYGMPPTSGLGIGIDRLTMMMTNNYSIREVLFFPQMRPE